MSLPSDSTPSKAFCNKESYFDIDDILATQERVPVVFQVPALNLGYLDSSSETNNIEAGAAMELPFWMAKALSTRGKHMVSVDLPNSYKESQREILGAEAGVVNLHKWGPYFYKFGMCLLCFEHPESTDIAKSLLQTLQNRFRGIMDSAQNASYEEIASVTKKLDVLEMSIFRVGQKSIESQLQWEKRQIEKLTVSKVIVNHRKRKRIHIENDQ
ncbi:hypothetical protein CAPTEDRAFT_21464 [Capitella teleta]|uniref:DNA replication complex GINS protein PSF3 n=1 Tax=Capitella teleta TaxID=283909 RepID=R7TT89_CAPTE|nr:hypothetical protein CAPTEDRAFT_21464 [Capitella teleta]|eukprot:ELT96859.1 hypothetical protein CAPTEDRAFT_21464 [Capitella teleta]